ncbi:MAG: phage tail sheath C-terminal domain-containing protein [Bacteroidota bacterium]
MPVPLTSYKTPGVYVQEIRKLPPSIAQVETAIPVFIGYTQKAELESTKDLQMKPTRIRSLNEYELYFGTTTPEDIQIGIDTNSVNGRRTIKVELNQPVKYYMYYAVQMFYANGGGECFIISVGDLTDPVDSGELEEGMMLLKEQLDPTLILFPDAVSLVNDKFTPLMKAGLQFCADPKFTNFFLIMDVKHQKEIKNTDGSIQNIDDDATEFRKVAGSLDEYKYGAAYYPYLLSNIPIVSDPDQIKIVSSTVDQETLSQQKARLETLRDSLQAGDEKNKVIADIAAVDARIALENAAKAEQAKIKTEEDKLPALLLSQETVGDIARAMDEAVAEGKDKDETKAAAKEAAKPVPVLETEVDNVDITGAATAAAARDLINAAVENKVKVGADDLATQIQKVRQAITDATNAALDEFQTAADAGVYTNATAAIISVVDNSLYNAILAELDTVKGSVIMPPSSAMAGAYARVDNSRGVFQSPANIGLGGVVRPYRKISDEVQDGLNVDTKAGKSINAIRTFIGRGTLVWGARTLAGNDREWRYVSVRRFFNMVEESVKRALLGFVFEPNNRNTWVSVRASIEAFLETQWRAGALLGSTPEEAFSVQVGMPETFTEAEMLDGFMVVEIGMAVVRPAEFIVLKFMHKFELGQS